MALGWVVSGSVRNGVKIILEGSQDIEDYPIGSLIIISGNRKRYLALISDVGISGSEVPIVNLGKIPKKNYDIIMEKLGLKYSYGWLEAILIAEGQGSDTYECETFPGYSSEIPDDFHKYVPNFFDRENKVNLWNIGKPRTPGGIDVYIPIDIFKLSELSFGIFGKSGTGKTFLGNILAYFFILYDNYLASKGYIEGKPLRLLIFDMHSEYGLYLKDNLGNRIADGVGRIIKDKFEIYSPSRELYDKYDNIRPLKINYLDLDIDDISLLSKVFGLSEAFISRLYDYIKIIREDIKLGDMWVLGLLASDDMEKIMHRSEMGVEILNKVKNRCRVERLDELYEKIIDKILSKLGQGALISYISQIPKIRSIMLRYPFTLNRAESPIEEIVDNLVSMDGLSIIISMGEYERETPLYMMIANLIAKKLRDKLKEMRETETKIIIFLEEAHKFLGKDIYLQSPFGFIAREMRKLGVSLCIIDQRPSELDRDVISMLWTNFVFTLTDQRDIETSVLASPNPQLYSKIVPRLRRKNVLIYGDTVNFPVVVDVIDYSDIESISRSKDNIEKLMDGLRGAI